jgi:hypothetical protein
MNRYRIAALKPEFDGGVKLATRRVQFRDSYVPDFSSRLAQENLGTARLASSIAHHFNGSKIAVQPLPSNSFLYQRRK